MINITKTCLPELDNYIDYLKSIWKNGWLTNNGPLLLELEDRLKKYLDVNNIVIVSNGTLALQIAIKALFKKGEIITTPFSYVATSSSLVWQECKPVFCDINNNFSINTSLLEKLITKNTKGFLFTHIYGIPCNIEEISKIAEKHNLKVIYDAAQAFAVKYKNKSIFHYGDISIASFHATKIFHTAEGGAIITSDDTLAEKLRYMRNFGHNGPEQFYGLGINGKLSELHAAMGLCVLPNVNKSIELRKNLSAIYDRILFSDKINLKKPTLNRNTSYNYSYYPIVFENSSSLQKVKNELENLGINCRRYFFPSLNTLPYLEYKKMIVSEDIASKVLCLPLYDELNEGTIKKICEIIIKNLKH